MFGQIGRMISATMVGLVMLVGFLVSRYDGGSANAAIPPADMTRKDVFGSARLSAAERTDGVATCHRRISGLAFVFAARGKSKRAEASDSIRRFCDCFVNQVEDRSSKMQYAMAMAVLGNGYAIRDYRSFPAFPKYKAAAARHGMSGDDFETMRRELGRSLTQSAEQCVENVK